MDPSLLPVQPFLSQSITLLLIMCTVQFILLTTAMTQLQTTSVSGDREGVSSCCMTMCSK